MGLTLVSPPAVEAVTLAEVKTHLRVSGTSQDAELTSYIRSAARFVERQIERSLTTRTLKLTLDSFSDAIHLPFGPVQSITSVQYVDTAGLTQTVSPTDYTLDNASSRHWLVRNSEADWPAMLDAVNVLSITYVAGTATLAPEFEDLKPAILFQVQILEGRVLDGAMLRALQNARDEHIMPFRWLVV